MDRNFNNITQALDLFYDGGNGVDECMNDLLTDLRHLCLDRKMDFDKSVAMSEIHFNAEGGHTDELEHDEIVDLGKVPGETQVAGGIPGGLPKPQSVIKNARNMICPKCGRKSIMYGEKEICIFDNFQLEEAPAKPITDVDKDNPITKCDNCGKQFMLSELNGHKNFWERIEPGSEIPAGDCPDCGAFAYLVKQTPPNDHKIKLVIVFDKKDARIKEPTKTITMEFDSGSEKNIYIQGFCDAEKQVSLKYGSGHTLDYYIIGEDDAEFEDWEKAIADGRKTRAVLDKGCDSLAREFCGPSGYYS